MYFLGLCGNNSFPGDCGLSFVWEKRERGAQSPAQSDGLLLEGEQVVVQPLQNTVFSYLLLCGTEITYAEIFFQVVYLEKNLPCILEWCRYKQ